MPACHYACHTADHAVSRRGFLGAAGALGATAALGTAGFAAPGAGAELAKQQKRVLVVFLHGGVSQLETWDPKPNAPAEVRGPFRPIRTTVPGTHLSECFPRMGAAADRFALVRTVHHDEAPIHETGHQLMQTGHLFRTGPERPHYGAVVSKEFGPRRAGVPANALVPGPIESTGVSVSHGQGPSSDSAAAGNVAIAICSRGKSHIRTHQALLLDSGRTVTTTISAAMASPAIPAASATAQRSGRLMRPPDTGSRTPVVPGAEVGRPRSTRTAR